MRTFHIIVLVLLSLQSYAQFIVNNGLTLHNTTVLETKGDWTSAPGSVLVNHGTIRLGDSFINDGILDAASTGGFTLDFASSHTFKPGGKNFGSLHKIGAGTATVAGTIHLSDSLILSNGLLTFAAPDTLVVSGNAVVTANTASYVQGLMARSGTGEAFFPLGIDGHYLPLRLLKMQATRATASVVLAPDTASAGPGVETLVDFPYMWRVRERHAADTSAYVEISYPKALASAATPVVARLVGGSLVGMGARHIEDTGTRQIVRSYSRALNGDFALAEGFPIDPVTDSLALVALYDATNGASWTTNDNWKTGEIATWFGVQQSGQTITALTLAANNLAGDVPDQLADILGLEIIDFADNAITSIPDFTDNTEITTLDVSGNKLTFESLEPNALVPGFHYIGQDKFGTALDTSVPVGTDYPLFESAGGSSTVYQWKRNNVAVPEATSSVLVIPSINRGNMGDYVLEATNPALPALTLQSETQRVLAHATISGTLFAEEDVPASLGEMTLFRITPTAYDTTAQVSVSSDGTFIFDKVILADYQLLGFADTLTYERALPTYYTNTIFWEEADTVFLENNVEGMQIVANLEPAAPSGHGFITGIFEEDDGTGRTGEMHKPKRVSNAGVSARRVERVGRGKEEEVLTLVNYVFTNDEGEFSLGNLPEGEYRINIQYPGYPMNASTDITLVIGTGLESHVQVNAMVEEGKIAVRKLTITGLPEENNYRMEVYPNPAVDVIRMQFPSESVSRQVTMIDLNGKRVQTGDARGKDVQVNVSTVDRGMYLLQVREKGLVVKTLKVSIE